MSGSDEASRLEALWAGEFGQEYIERNANAGEGRQAFWAERLGTLEVESVLEVGCNVGANLLRVADLLGQSAVAGVDINKQAIEYLRKRLPDADLRVSGARSLPFRDHSFDLCFTTGVLIHQPPDELPQVIDEIVRCSRRYVLCAEYYAEELVEVPYRGQEGALFKRDFGSLFLERHDTLGLLESGFLAASEGVWDDITWWVFEKL